MVKNVFVTYSGSLKCYGEECAETLHPLHLVNLGSVLTGVG